MSLTLNLVGLATLEGDLSGTPAGWIASAAGLGGTVA